MAAPKILSPTEALEEHVYRLEEQVHALAKALIELGHVHAAHVHWQSIEIGGTTSTPQDMR